MSAETKRIHQAALGELLAEAGLGLPPEALARLWRFHVFLRQQNPRLNLTRIYNFHSMVRKHYVDSLLVARLLEKHGLAWPEVTLDLGTGPGFPGIPLAVALPDRRFILAEGRGPRVEFLKEAVQVAGLDNTEVFGGRIHAGRGRAVDAVITRAVELMPATIERMLPFVKAAGGLFVFMKGPNCDEEIAAVREQFGDWLDLAFDEDYTLPDSRDRRRLVVWRRNERPSPPVAEPDRIALNAGPRHRREVIHSRDNDKFKATRTLHTSRGIKKQGQALVSGLRVVNEYLSRHPELCRAVLVPETDGEDLELPTTPEGRAFQEHWAETDLPLRVFGRELFRELDLIGTGPPLLLIEAPVLDRYDSAPSPPDSAPGCTLFLPMGDPENLGAALRSAAAFEVSECVLLEEAAHPYHPRALRAAAGATPRLPLKKGPSVAGLAATVPDLFVLDPDGDDIRNVEFPPRFGLLAGPEEGLGATGGARRVRVPASDAVESLNTTVALSIALYILKERGVL